jgi:hypothetical protein
VVVPLCSHDCGALGNGLEDHDHETLFISLNYVFLVLIICDAMRFYICSTVATHGTQLSV